jgi:hypothetical protein
VEGERRWLLTGISIRDACASIPKATVRTVILRDTPQQGIARSIYGGAGLLDSTYIVPRMPMTELGRLLRSWLLTRPLITIIDSLGGIVPPPKCWQDGRDYRNSWWTPGRHLVMTLQTMQASIDLQPFPQPLALVVLLGAVTYESLAEEYRDALDAMFPLAHVR